MGLIWAGSVPCLLQSPHYPSWPLQSQTLMKKNLPPKLHISAFLIKKYSTGLLFFFFRENSERIIRGTDCFTIFVLQYNCERFSGFSLQEMRRRRGGSGFKILSVFVHCEFNVCEKWNISVWWHRPAQTWETAPASPPAAQVNTGMGILIPHLL